MKLFCVSDLHGYDMSVPGEFWNNLPEGGIDVMCICGDIMPLDLQTNHSLGKVWVEEEFLPSVRKVMDKVGARVCLMTPGNHDFIFESEFVPEFPEWFKVLVDESYEVDGVKFWGMPWCSMGTMSRWSFDLREEGALEEKVSMIPMDAVVLITHCPPFGTPASGQWVLPYGCVCGSDVYADYGNEELTLWIRRNRIDSFLSVVLCGHIHEAVNHRFEYGGIEVVNCSIKNESYNVYRFGEVVEI